MKSYNLLMLFSAQQILEFSVLSYYFPKQRNIKIILHNNAHHN
ncbi:hypothetical protein EMUCRT_0129 [Ehrlichia cf. muris str. EmCRT]|uniref:Uncharacterized protein n=1 Tax=Ehrlichia cf. muris str. EmCRT TaxID=1359167 RepID=A0A0F3NDW1_9RICK|nr:hypothetical protein EMUCRT_0129 [Ehrlichia cf. muris str. EmCRT]